MITLFHCLCVALLLFVIGGVGVLFRRNILVVLMSLELMLNGANLALVSFSRYHHHVDGQLWVFFTITVAAAEVAVGLALVAALFQRHAAQRSADPSPPAVPSPSA